MSLRVGARRFLSPIGTRTIYKIIPCANNWTSCALQGNTSGFSLTHKVERNNLYFLSPQYFEQDDPDLYLSKVKYILENDVEEMELYFVEEEYDKDGQLLKVDIPTFQT